MLVHLKSFILSEKIAWQFTPCASSKEILKLFDCNVAHKQYCSVLQQGYAFRDNFLIFKMAVEVSGIEHDERPLCRSSSI